MSPERRADRRTLPRLLWRGLVDAGAGMCGLQVALLHLAEGREGPETAVSRRYSQDGLRALELFLAAGAPPSDGAPT